jgi:putative salt-induced outer membrane protein
MRQIFLLLVVVVFMVPSVGAAASAAASVWDSSIELGAVIATGNTRQQNFKFVMDSTNESVLFEHTAHFDGLRSAENGVVRAAKYYTYYQGDYKLEDFHSLFGRTSYSDDKLNGFKYQADVTFGYSRSFIESDDVLLRGDIGFGVRRSELELGGADTEFISRFAARYEWQMSDNARFKQLLSSEVGRDSTIMRSNSSVQSTLIANLAMKLALNIKHQTSVPLTRKKTDTETSVTLVYTF